MNIPITQSKAWSKLQQEFGKKTFLKSNTDYHYLAILNHTPAGNYLYCPYGPCFDNQKGLDKALQSLKEIASKTNSIYIRIEPQSQIFLEKSSTNIKKSKDLNPKETWLLDLTGSDEELKSKLPSRLLRYHKSAAKKGITIETSKNTNDIKQLLKLQKALASEKGISTFSEKYLQTELKQPFATLYLVKKYGSEEAPTDGWPSLEAPHRVQSRGGEKGEDRARREEVSQNNSSESIIAAGLVFDDDSTRYNLQGAQSDEGRKLHATGILTIQLILDAKKQGLKTFDFWGIAPEGAGSDHPWAGFTNFKKTFDGYEQDYAGTHDIVLKPARYKLYQILRKIRRSV